MLSRRQLAREVAKRTGYYQAPVYEIIKETFAVLGDELQGHNKIKISGFGTFDVYLKKGRQYKNENISDEMQYVEDKYYPRFKPSDKLINKVK